MLRRRLLQAAAVIATAPGPTTARSVEPTGWRVAALPKRWRRWLEQWARKSSWVRSDRQAGDPHEWTIPAPALSTLKHVYQFDELAIAVHWTGPDGAVQRAEGFWAEWGEFKGWVVRWSPGVAGRWQGQVSLLARHEVIHHWRQPLGIEADRLDTLAPVRLDPQHPTFFGAGGEPLYPIGLNLGWSTPVASVLDRYGHWFDQLASAGGNFARIWMSSWCFGIEWADTGLGSYRERQDHAHRLDQVLAMAQARGIRVMLCLLNHGAFSIRADSEWAKNPYNQINGGPLRAPQDFFTDESAIACFQNRLRYIVARWSHSPALHSWEIWNEVTWVPHTPASLVNWFAASHKTFDQYDPYQRLRTSSWADSGPPQAWRDLNLDFAQQHDYTPLDLAQRYQQTAHAWHRLADRMAVIPGELGARSSPPRNDAEVTLHSRQLHDGLWAPLMMGYASTALYWWWDHFVDKTQQWRWYHPFRRWIDHLHRHGVPYRSMTLASMDDSHIVASTVDHLTQDSEQLAPLECWTRYSHDHRCVMAWVRRRGNNGPSTQSTMRSQIRIKMPAHFPALPSGMYQGHIMATHHGNIVQLSGLLRDGELTVELDITGDSVILVLAAAGHQTPDIS